jgi:hypothetical protein
MKIVRPGQQLCRLEIGAFHQHVLPHTTWPSLPSTTTVCSGTASPLCCAHAAYQSSANLSDLAHVVLEGIYVSGFLKSYNEPKEAPPVGGMP